MGQAVERGHGGVGELGDDRIFSGLTRGILLTDGIFMELKTVLHPNHLALGARMVPFGGWEMPVQYSSILAEVKAVRTAVGIFDVSHMGRVCIGGPQAAEFLDWALTGSASGLRVGRARYCMICNPAGGVIDDTIFYRLAPDRFLLIPNAGNREEVLTWFQGQVDQKFPGGVTLDDRTMETGLIAVQGPESAPLLDGLGQLDDGRPFSELFPFTHGRGHLPGVGPEVGITVGHTGYTGEDGFELALPGSDAPAVWEALLEQGAVPCGLGARDVLRLEASLPLHGHEIDRSITPIEAGLGRFVRQEGDFVGAEVLQRQRREGTERTLVGLTLPGRSAPRAGYAILDQGEEVGRVTSGSYSPTLDTSIAMGYVLTRYADDGRQVEVDIRGRMAAAEIVSLPFYFRPRSS